MIFDRFKNRINYLRLEKRLSLFIGIFFVYHFPKWYPDCVAISHQEFSAIFLNCAQTPIVSLFKLKHFHLKACFDMADCPYNLLQGYLIQN
jgi:hypothetical protein